MRKHKGTMLVYITLRNYGDILSPLFGRTVQWMYYGLIYRQSVAASNTCANHHYTVASCWTKQM